MRHTLLLAAASALALTVAAFAQAPTAAPTTKVTAQPLPKPNNSNGVEPHIRAFRQPPPALPAGMQVSKIGIVGTGNADPMPALDVTGAIQIELKPGVAATLIKHGHVYTLGKEGTLADADVLIVNGKIMTVQPNLTVPGAKVIDAHGKPVTPGLMASWTTLGIQEIQLVNETSDVSPNQSLDSAAYDTADAINPRLHAHSGGADRGRHALADGAGGLRRRVLRLRHRDPSRQRPRPRRAQTGWRTGGARAGGRRASGELAPRYLGEIPRDAGRRARISRPTRRLSPPRRRARPAHQQGRSRRAGTRDPGQGAADRPCRTRLHDPPGVGLYAGQQDQVDRGRRRRSVGSGEGSWPPRMCRSCSTTTTTCPTASPTSARP